MIEKQVSEIKFREDLYPRNKYDPSTIQRYAESIDLLPPIEVNQNNELIDGVHRWKAHQKMECSVIQVTVTETAGDAELLTLAIKRNAVHGLQLSIEDKRRMATTIYSATIQKDRAEKKKELASILSVTPQTLNNWLRDIDKSADEARNKLIFEMYLACYTQEEIGEAVGYDHSTVREKIRVLLEMKDFSKSTLHAVEYALDDDSLPRFTVWSFGSKTNKVGHFGNSEQTIIDWLVYLYTKPFDIVLDPLGGGGATIDVCSKRLRRYWVSDRKPIIEREKEIRQHDIINGEGKLNLPNLTGRWSDVKLIYLDPPYWWQAKGKYSDDPNDLANMDLDTFHKTLISIVNSLAKKAPSAHIALLMQPTQWAAENHQFTDHILSIFHHIKSPLSTRIQAPYQKASCSPPMYEWAEKEKQLLVLSREIVVWGPNEQSGNS